jgi:hypothetical protein
MSMKCYRNVIATCYIGIRFDSGCADVIAQITYKSL